ncbi:hypothetical protein [Hymenobacter sedentarius]|uniref:hypothetical protein n=1 Tax=Hymenobacter sedentarius TaxID=1411621 RepID=UPI0009006064|nr:hypothetical protein [Hymenobacter sedentarius]
MPRVIIKLGDIFRVEVHEGITKFFQYIGDDNTQLNSRVISVFQQEYLSDKTPDFDSIRKAHVDFHAHCDLRAGITRGFWEKAGKAPISATPKPVFRDTYDYGIAPWQEPILVSNNWVVWEMGEPMRTVGTLQGLHQQADIGLVMTPEDIVYRMKNGHYDMPNYPFY